MSALVPNPNSEGVAPYNQPRMLTHQQLDPRPEGLTHQIDPRPPGFWQVIEPVVLEMQARPLWQSEDCELQTEREGVRTKEAIKNIQVFSP